MDGRGKILKRVNYLRRQSTHRTRKRVKYRMTLLVSETDELGGAKRKKLARSSLEEVNKARKVAGLAPLEERIGLRREAEWEPLGKGGELPREALKGGHFEEGVINMLEVVEKIKDGGLNAASNIWSIASPSNKGPSLSMMDCDEANNNRAVDGKAELEEVNDLGLGQFDMSAVALELIINIIEENVGGGLRDGGR